GSSSLRDLDLLFLYGLLVCICSCVFFFLMIRARSCSSLFPYTTLFRSLCPPFLPTASQSQTAPPLRLRGENARTANPNIRAAPRDRKSTRLNSSHRTISYAVFCLKKKNSLTSTMLTNNTEHHANGSHDH